MLSSLNHYSFPRSMFLKKPPRLNREYKTYISDFIDYLLLERYFLLIQVGR